MTTQNLSKLSRPRLEQAGANWDARWTCAEGAFDPSYERTNAALRRWVDGMEQALLTATASRSAGRTHRLASNQTPRRR